MGLTHSVVAEPSDVPFIASVDEDRLASPTPVLCIYEVSLLESTLLNTVVVYLQARVTSIGASTRDWISVQLCLHCTTLPLEWRTWSDSCSLGSAGCYRVSAPSCGASGSQALLEKAPVAAPRQAATSYLTTGLITYYAYAVYRLHPTITQNHLTWSTLYTITTWFTIQRMC